LWVQGSEEAIAAIRAYEAYLCAEVLADSVVVDSGPEQAFRMNSDLEGNSVELALEKA
jgi:hypothetical protein